MRFVKVRKLVFLLSLINSKEKKMSYAKIGTQKTKLDKNTSATQLSTKKLKDMVEKVQLNKHKEKIRKELQKRKAL